MWFILGCGEHAVNTFPRETGQGASEKEGGLESLAGPVAQWQSTRLITGGAQVRILPGPPFPCRPSPDVDTPHRGQRVPPLRGSQFCPHLSPLACRLAALAVPDWPPPASIFHRPSSSELRSRCRYSHDSYGAGGARRPAAATDGFAEPRRRRRRCSFSRARSTRGS